MINRLEQKLAEKESPSRRRDASPRPPRPIYILENKIAKELKNFRNEVKTNLTDRHSRGIPET